MFVYKHTETTENIKKLDICRIKNVEFSGYDFYMNPIIYED